MTILVTNDDGYKSWGINTLYKAAVEVFGDDVVAVAPEKLQSSAGMSFTFHKPLRVEKLDYEGMPCLIVSGKPADCTFMALNHFYSGRIDMVLSGVNYGMNVGLSPIYSSGTISAALYAAISKVPSVAFSKHLSNSKSQDEIKKEMDSVYSRLVDILEKIKKSSFPPDIELLNINFPKSLEKDTSIKVVKADRKVFQDVVQQREDPLKRPYYWLYGTLRKDLDPNADVANLLNGNITVTPIELHTSDEEKLSSIRRMFL